MYVFVYLLVGVMGVSPRLAADLSGLDLPLYTVVYTLHYPPTSQPNYPVTASPQHIIASSAKYQSYLRTISLKSSRARSSSDPGRLAVIFAVCISSSFIIFASIHTLQSSNPRFIQLSASSFLGGRLLLLLFAFL